MYKREIWKVFEWQQHPTFLHKYCKVPLSPLYGQFHEGCGIAQTPPEIELINWEGGQNLPPKLVSALPNKGQFCPVL